MISRKLSCIGRRFLSSAFKRPDINAIFPKKKFVNRLLFELDSRLSFGKLYPVYELLYRNLDKNADAVKIPRGIQPTDLMIMKKVLELTRYRSKSTNKHLLDLENEILYRAAELGDKNASSSLAFEQLRDISKSSLTDVEHSKKIIKALYQQNHPLTLKLTGELAMSNGDGKKAEECFLKFLDYEDETVLAGEVYGKLGELALRKPALAQAEAYFLRSIKYSPVEYSLRSYYYLGELYMNSEPLKARALLESAASQGLRESFKVLGYLELNYFNDYRKAKEWFRIGMDIHDFECLLGYTDCLLKLKDLGAAQKSIEKLTNLVAANPAYKKTYGNVINCIKDDLEVLHGNLEGLENIDTFIAGTSPKQKGRWDI
ncbi:HCL097Cp [Eremothecium sinecaudum]|uniref:HCL097Cp n=1 Tax=Eremothecium sinecaudum TaxID=45286 RepID=A0A0X8HRD9_9SACH|nr:HCL097Cp [Eremothecium sinecaudum]AMD20054.1 HCL097Cp [Eremothecium sinecaudum]